MREDRYTHSEHDAGAYEAMRGADEAYDDRPSASDLAHDDDSDEMMARDEEWEDRYR